MAPLFRVDTPIAKQGNEPRKHHYVPKCWLAGFTETGEKDARLWVTDLSRQKQWPSTPENAGHIKDFYRLADPAPDPVVVETFFSKLEDLAAPVMKRIDRERTRPDRDELDALLHFMAYQWVRVPRFRPFALQIVERITRGKMSEDLQSRERWMASLVADGMDPDSPATEYESVKRIFESGNWSISAQTGWYIQRAFQDVNTILDCLRERYWGISFTDQGRLIASDNPVALEGAKGQMIGFRNADFVFYPVSRHALLFGTLQQVERPVENFNYFAGMNTMMLIGADAQVYSHIGNFSWLDEYRKHQTDWRSFSKDRF
jgi:hypothetical protein